MPPEVRFRVLKWFDFSDIGHATSELVEMTWEQLPYAVKRTLRYHVVR